MKSFIFFIIIACTLALAAAFSASNDQLVDFNYLIALDSFKLSSLLIGAFASGLVVAGVCMSLFMMKLRLSLSKFKRKSKRQVVELERLRAAEIKG
ncbi:LapA family protein [Moritella yayanosii]|uniref:Probable lipopolysaccharide assembly protein A n=1 Tax=Moritella yayanosii TaxID=69539 RepID=A0A330LRX6_9GAMM|nr:lipopolysaccharide assembly protein LapA domain-containing protein [Moritella yayanosii]SQD76865.1 putative lipopolysaccharide assembly protein A [Moritella yayanosii]